MTSGQHNFNHLGAGFLRGTQGQQVLPWLQVWRPGILKEERSPHSNKMPGRRMLMSCSEEQSVVL